LRNVTISVTLAQWILVCINLWGLVISALLITMWLYLESIAHHINDFEFLLVPLGG
jgi:hypothetical protein